MCPHGYHHNGFMATPALGTQEVHLHIVWIALWSHQSAQTAYSERCIVQIVNVPQKGLSTQSKRLLKLPSLFIKISIASYRISIALYKINDIMLFLFTYLQITSIIKCFSCHIMYNCYSIKTLSILVHNIPWVIFLRIV